MPFFIRGRKTADRSKPKKLVKKHTSAINVRSKQPEKRKQYVKEDEEITSDDDDDFLNEFKKKKTNDTIQYLEQEEETAQEKKIRLAKQYLEEIKQQKQEELDDEELDEAIGLQLKEDVLDAAGKLQKPIADTITRPDEETIKFLKCKHHSLSLTCLVVSHDDKLIFTGSKDCNIVKWSIDGDRLGVIVGGIKGLSKSKSCHISHILCLAISTDGLFLASGDVDGDIRIWNPSDLSHLKKFNKHKDSVSCLAFRWGSHSLFSGSHDRMVMLWDLDSMAFAENMGGHQDSITGLDALHKESCITSGGRDEMVMVNIIADEKQLRFSANQNSIDGVKLINEKSFVTYGQDGSLATWTTGKRKPQHSTKNAHGMDPISGVPHWITSVATLTNTDLIASGSIDGFINLWKLEKSDHKLTKIFNIPICGVVNGLYFTHTGSHLIAVVGKEHKLGRWFTEREAKNVLVIIPIGRNS